MTFKFPNGLRHSHTIKLIIDVRGPLVPDSDTVSRNVRFWDHVTDRVSVVNCLQLTYYSSPLFCPWSRVSLFFCPIRWTWNRTSFSPWKLRKTPSICISLTTKPFFLLKRFGGLVPKNKENELTLEGLSRKEYEWPQMCQSTCLFHESLVTIVLTYLLICLFPCYCCFSPTHLLLLPQVVSEPQSNYRLQSQCSEWSIHRNPCYERKPKPRIKLRIDTCNHTPCIIRKSFKLVVINIRRKVPLLCTKRSFRRFLLGTWEGSKRSFKYYVRMFGISTIRYI